MKVGAPAVIEAHTSHVNMVGFADGGALFSAGFSGELRSWRVGSWELERDWIGHERSVNGLAIWSERLISGGADGTLRLWGRAEGDCLQTVGVTRDRRGIVQLRALPDANHILISTAQRMLELRRTSDLQSVRSLKSVSKNIGVLAVDPAGARVLVGGRAATIRLFGLPDCQELASCDAHAVATVGACFFDGGRSAFSVGYNGDLCIWNMEEFTLRSRHTLLDSPGYYQVSIAREHAIAVISAPNALLLFDLQEERILATIETPSKANHGTAFSEGDRYLALATAHKNLLVWEVDWNH